MGQKQELFLRVLGGLILVYVVVKVFGPLILTWFEEIWLGKKKKKDIDIDVLIERKKQMLRSSSGMSAEGVAEIQSTKKDVPPLHQWYADCLVQENDQDRKKELARCLKLFDSLQWGVSDELSRVEKAIMQRWGVQVSQGETLGALKKISSSNLIRKFSPKEPPALSTLLKVVETICFLQILVDINRRDLRKKLARQFHTDENTIEKVIIHHLSSVESGNKESLVGHILQNKIQMTTYSSDQKEKWILDLIFDQDSKTWGSANEIIKSFQEEIDLYSALTPVAETKNDQDTTGALSILGLEKNHLDDLDKIKKSYKRLAVQKHPDKLKGKGIPPQYESIATENFALIKAAYDILNDYHKNKG